MPKIVYFWWAVALLLIVGEILAPGVFMLWLGIAAAAMGLILLLGGSGMSYLWQAVVFGVLAFVSVGVYWKFLRGNERVSDQPLLNKRGAQLVGRVVPLLEPIVNGRGKVQIGDALWTVRGAEAPAGTRVVIESVSGMNLDVRPAEQPATPSL